MTLKKIAVSLDQVLEVDIEMPQKGRTRAGSVCGQDRSEFALLIEAISVCHTVKPVIVEQKEKGESSSKLDYQASSPDEVALI